MNAEQQLARLPVALQRKVQAQLDRLPEQFRDQVRAQLARLPPDQLAELLERGSPMLDKLAARGDALRKTAGIRRSQGHYNQTVQAGDRRNWLLFPLFIVGVIVALLHAAGLFSAA